MPGENEANRDYLAAEAAKHAAKMEAVRKQQEQAAAETRPAKPGEGLKDVSDKEIDDVFAGLN